MGFFSRFRRKKTEHHPTPDEVVKMVEMSGGTPLLIPCDTGDPEVFEAFREVMIKKMKPYRHLMCPGLEWS